MSHSYKAEAVVLKRVNLGEADRLVTVFSRSQGKMRLLARGIRRINSRKKGHLELFNRVKLQITNGKNLDLILEAETIDNYTNLRDNLNRVRIAYLLAELIDKLTPDNQEHEEVYTLLVNALSQLNSDAASNDLIADFERELLTLLGFGLPKQLDRDSLEAHILTIIEKPLKSKKLR